MTAKQVECPRCHVVAEHPPAFRKPAPGVLDVGWRCHACGYEWGFEYQGDKGGAR